MQKKNNQGELIELAIDQAFAECKVKVYEAYITALDSIQAELKNLQYENERYHKTTSEARWEASDMIRREG